MVAATAVWDYALLTRTPTFLPGLKFAVLAAGLAAIAFVLGGHQLLGAARRLIPAVILTLVLALGLGSTAYAVSTAAQTHSGAIPTAGPGGSAGFGAAGGPGGMGGGMGGGGGGGDGGGQASSELSALLANTTTTWAAATNGSQSAAGLELASGKSVIGIGGWSSGDNAPTLSQFKQYVAEGKITYYVSGGRGGGGRGDSSTAASEIQAWVTANFTATTVGNSTVYKLIG
jgi:hypothetical protein